MRSTLLLMAALLAGCAPGATQPPAANPNAARLAAAQIPPEPLAGKDFKNLASENARYAGGVGGAPMSSGAMTAAAPVPMAAPSMAPGGMRAPMEPPAPAKGLTSGNMNGGYYGYGMGFMPFGGGGEPMALVSLTQAEAPGTAGPYLAVIKDVAGPVVKAWAADARLMSSGASTGPDGLLLTPTPLPSGVDAACAAVYGPQDETAWRLSYMSSARAETLNFYITREKTLIVRARWAPVDLAALDVAVDSDVAIKALTSAIETQGFQAEEEKTGLDYFMGGAFAASPQNCYPKPIPMMPMPMVADANGGQITMSPERDEVVFDVPAGVRWNINLQVMLGKPVWELSYYKPYDPSQQATPAPMGPQEDPGFYFNDSARGLIDAKSGAVVRFSRPNRHYYPRPVGPDGKPVANPEMGWKPGMPTPMPSAPPPSQTPPPAETPSPVPTPSATTSAEPA